MTWLIALVAMACFVGLGTWYFIATPAEKIARQIRYVVPLAVAAIGVIMSLTGRIALGAPLLFFAYALFSRLGGVQVQGGNGLRSTVRSALLEMELDHETGALNGLVLHGEFEGRDLDGLSDKELMEFARQAGEDPESAQLLEAYLDRRMPGWRDDPQADFGAREAGPAQSGAMTEQEAYQILGLEPSATIADVRKAHRRLMQSVHPDVGGSAFLAQRINEAKDFLLTSHKNGS